MGRSHRSRTSSPMNCIGPSPRQSQTVLPTAIQAGLAIPIQLGLMDSVVRPSLVSWDAKCSSAPGGCCACYRIEVLRRRQLTQRRIPPQFKRRKKPAREPTIWDPRFAFGGGRRGLLAGFVPRPTAPTIHLPPSRMLRRNGAETGPSARPERATRVRPPCPQQAAESTPRPSASRPSVYLTPVPLQSSG